MENVTRFKAGLTVRASFSAINCHEQFTVTVRHHFRDSHIPLRKWLDGLRSNLLCEEGYFSTSAATRTSFVLTARQWHMAMRIRHAMSREPMASLLKALSRLTKLYVGGKPRPAQTKRRNAGVAQRKRQSLALVERAVASAGAQDRSS